MKKLLNILLSALLAVSAFSLAGCKEGEQSSSSESASVVVESDTNVFEDGYYILADFESYEQCIQFGHGGYFGKVIQSKEYVTHGEQSARLEVFGYSYQWGYVSPTISLFTNNDYFQKKDFSDCDMFAFDMYSIMEYDLIMQFIIHASDSTEVFVNFTIKPGWNYFELSREDLGISWKDEIEWFTFVFEKGNKHEETQTIYFDNFRARKAVATEEEAPNLGVKTPEEMAMAILYSNSSYAGQYHGVFGGVFPEIGRDAINVIGKNGGSSGKSGFALTATAIKAFVDFGFKYLSFKLEYSSMDVMPAYVAIITEKDTSYSYLLNKEVASGKDKNNFYYFENGVTVQLDLQKLYEVVQNDTLIPGLGFVFTADMEWTKTGDAYVTLSEITFTKD